MIKIKIDGISFNAKRDSKIIEIMDEVGIYVPRFCYHKKLSIAANCRMCLIEVEKIPKLLPACATRVFDGMSILTNTERVISAQQGVMEFLLINHPLDCPVCDQGGECDLQDLSIGYGCFSSRFVEKKRTFKDYDLGALISTNISRCILCSRCVRFCREIAGIENFGIVNRGTNSRIFTFLKSHLQSGLSGNVIDLCPVGALVAKPNKFQFRPWDLIQSDSISHHDCVGSNLYVHVLNNKVLRVVPKKNESLNETWISDRDRFSYEGLCSDDRVKYPMLKDKGKWINISWTEALKYIYSKLIGVKNEFGAEQIAGIASPNSTVEEFFILQKFLRNFGSNNLDHRLKQVDFQNQEKLPNFIGMDIDVDNLDKMDFVFLIGSDIVKEQPIIGLKLRKILNRGGSVFVLNPVNFSFFMNLTDKFVVNPKFFTNTLASIIKTYYTRSSKSANYFGMDNLFEFVKSSDLYFTIIDSILKAKNKLVLLGSYASSSYDFSKVLSLSILLSKIIKSNLGVLTDGANSTGGWLSGFVPHRLPGGRSNFKDINLSISDIFQKKLKAYILFGLDMEFDLLHSDIAIKALSNSNFVLSFSSFKSDILLEMSDIILPIASSYENVGTFINVSGLSQSFSPAIPLDYEAKFGWQAINMLGGCFRLPGFPYENSLSILKEFKLLCEFNNKLTWSIIKESSLLSNIKDDIVFISSVSQYDIDPLVKRSSSLKKTHTRRMNVLRCNKLTFKKLKVEDNFIFLMKDGKKRKYLIFLDSGISDNCILVESHNNLDYKDLNLSYRLVLSNKI